MLNPLAILDRYSRWRHAGEEGSVIIYPQKNIGGIMFCILFTLVLALAALAFGYPAWLLILIALLTPRAVIERRRAVIVTETKLIYRPALGQPISVLLSDIVEVKESVIMVSYLLRPVLTAGVAITLKNAETKIIPLDFEERTQILGWLRSIVSIT